MNYYTYKIKKTFWKAVFKIGFIKKWYIGNELLKNPPTVYVNTGGDVENMTFINVTLKTTNDNKIINNTFKNTLKLWQYF